MTAAHSPAKRLAFYATPVHECSYLPERRAITLFADPHTPMNNVVYSELVRFGFRRSGAYVYRPRCEGCEDCIAVRIPVNEFRPDRSQRRTWERNRDLELTVRDAVFDEEHFELYKRYTRGRHPGGGMDSDSPTQYRQFLLSTWSDTRCVEFRKEGRLLAVAVVDCLDDGLSAMYTFYDPDETWRGLGVLAVLWQIAEARRLELPWVYLGYFIEACPKMSYKLRYHPLEGFVQGSWRRLP